MSSIGLPAATSGPKTKDDFINKAHEARQARELERRRETSATIIQALLKTNYTKRKLKREALGDFDSITKSDYFGQSGIDVLRTLRKVMFVCDKTKDRSTLDSLILLILNTSSPTGSKLNENELETNESTKDCQVKPNETKNSLIEEAIKESIVLSSGCNQGDCSSPDSTTSTIVDIDKSRHKNIIKLIIEDSTNFREKNLEGWLILLDQILNLCFRYLKDAESRRLDSQHIYNYLKLINLFTSKKTFEDANETGNWENCEKLSPKATELLRKFSIQLFERTLLKKRKSFLECITNLLFERIGSFRNDLKRDILTNYVKLALKLMTSQDKICEQQNNSTQYQPFKGPSQPEKEFQIEAIIKVLIVPGFIYNLERYSPESLLEFKRDSNYGIILNTLSNSQDFNYLTSMQSLCLLANLINLAALNRDLLLENVSTFVNVSLKILESCQKHMLKGPKAGPANKKLHPTNKTDGKPSNETSDVTFNPVLGWVVREDITSVDKEILKAQLSHLWNLKFLEILFADLIEACEKINTANESSQNNCNNRQKTQSINDNSQASGLFRRAVERATTTVSRTINSSTYSKTSSVSSSTSARAKLLTPEAARISSVCSLLYASLKTLCMVKQDILTGICSHDYFLPKLWTYISSLSSNNGLKAFLEHLTIYTKTNSPEFSILILFCECASHLISILDDSEFYEKQQPFKICDLIAISTFLNNFIYRIICNNLVSISNQEMDPILKSTHKLLTDLYKRDCRRKFTAQDHWIIKDIKLSLFLKDVEAGKPVAHEIMTMLPHAIPHKERVLIFRRLVAKDKAKYCTGHSTLISIHRSRIVEDGYQQLIRLPPHALKGLIRVKFINDFGLDEAGIDQDGVFKEFLEDTIKRVFDPSLNLFCSTSEQRLYPSPTSRLHEEYLSLFNFVGKMLGKAVYEGIVVDVPFATFFLSRVLGQPQSPLYSPIDELPSLDPELYKSLTYIKHYEGDVSDLDLTFSIDQDFMGKIITHDLQPGGSSVKVTRESRLRYIHSVAKFRLITQIEKQTEAFIAGFRSIIRSDWLSMFSASEFQRLISGDNTPIDLQDLRRNTKYFGGFHNNHRVVCWLWDILEKDFTAEEHRLFLKFITSCSKPPLLGFSNLEPPFSIRCVEVSDDQDLGDTVGSVLRGFFAIRRSDPVDRLPTSSTCFNLLKLPNYQRRSTLREKLRYAIHSNPGFELS